MSGSEFRDLVPMVASPQLEPSPDIGPEPVLRWVDINLLVVDRTFQREITSTGRKTILEIVENFRWDQFTPVIVCQLSDDSYSIIDGQHRATAALMHPSVTHVPCQVVVGDRRTLARAFVNINSRLTKITPLQIHHAGLTGMDPDALHIEAVCKVAKVNIPKSAKQTCSLDAGGTQALGAIKIALHKFGDKPVVAALRVLRELDRAGEGLLNRAAIAAFSEFMFIKPIWSTKNGQAELADLLNRCIFQMVQDAKIDRIEKGGTISSHLLVRVSRKASDHASGEVA